MCQWLNLHKLKLSCSTCWSLPQGKETNVPCTPRRPLATKTSTWDTIEATLPSLHHCTGSWIKWVLNNYFLSFQHVETWFFCVKLLWYRFLQACVNIWPSWKKLWMNTFGMRIFDHYLLRNNSELFFSFKQRKTVCLMNLTFTIHPLEQAIKNLKPFLQGWKESGAVK